MKTFSILLLSLCISLISYSQKSIELSEVPDHIGDSVEVKGKIFGVKFLANARNTPTFINIGADYPNQLLTVVIWGNVKEKLGYDPSDKKYIGSMAKIKGKLELFKNKPQIVILDPSQLLILIDEEVPISQIPPIDQK